MFAHRDQIAADRTDIIPCAIAQTVSGCIHNDLLGAICAVEFCKREAVFEEFGIFKGRTADVRASVFFADEGNQPFAVLIKVGIAFFAACEDETLTVLIETAEEE